MTSGELENGVVVGLTIRHVYWSDDLGNGARASLWSWDWHQWFGRIRINLDGVSKIWTTQIAQSKWRDKGGARTGKLTVVS